MAETTIPKQHYVTIQYRSNVKSEEGKLGFASPYTKDAAFAKRKNTQDRWAYGSTRVTIDPETNDITVLGSGSKGGYGHGEVDASTLFMTNCYPIIIDNELTEGFRIAESVRRHGWGGGGNVLWRISDPRGFELEVSSDNFARIVDCTTMVNGVIQGKCLWGRNGSTNVLLPEASDVYQAAKVLTEKIDKNVSLLDVTPGDTVEILNKGVGEEDAVCEYLGKYYFVTAEQGEDESSNRYSRYSTNGKFSLAGKQVDRYLFKSKDDGKYFVLSKPKVIDIVNKLESPRDKMVIAQEVNDWIGEANNSINGIYYVTCVSPTKLKLADVTAELVPTVMKLTEWPKIDSYSVQTIVAKKGDNFYISGSTGYNYNTPAKHTIIDIDATEIAKAKLNIGYTMSQDPGYRSYYGGSAPYIRTRNETQIFKFDELETFNIVLKTPNGLTSTVRYIGNY